MHGTGGDEHEPPHVGRAGGLDQLQRAEHVPFDKLRHTPLSAPKTAAGMVQGGVDNGVAAGNKLGGGVCNAQFSVEPLNRRLSYLETASVAVRSIPAATSVSLRSQASNEVTAQRNLSGAGDGDFHGKASPGCDSCRFRFYEILNPRASVCPGQRPNCRPGSCRGVAGVACGSLLVAVG